MEGSDAGNAGSSGDAGEEGDAGGADDGSGSAGSDATGGAETGASATVPVPAVGDGDTDGPGGALLVDGAGPGEVDTGGDTDGRTTGEVGPVCPVPAPLLDAVGRGTADVLGRPGRAEAPVPPVAPVPPGLAAAMGVVPLPAVGGLPGGRTPEPVPPLGGTEAVGSGEVSTLPAGEPSFWPGTGSQGASELPESSVTTMATA
ncbi:hypothetical protein [Streptomyces sp. NPDC005423]|uniref:hypothetical protein n=1 Tax=Streptomyces sp. NPDC005423 TaxID=3155343 RepID=UPI0033A18218